MAGLGDLGGVDQLSGVRVEDRVAVGVLLPGVLGDRVDRRADRGMLWGGDGEPGPFERVRWSVYEINLLKEYTGDRD
ncbi:hypothetical protein LWC34_04945 [Kibdelosporangium philippinense]|uniref:Uncharacterized protein n=1 Tax=Kibdelosporangium philippinense TaxID=211113 RepID=A0ABS8Z3X2_9PSEU|nr:hypothetical protein [Kibdelosporangium philippinense]MCE7002177.1 hypothetical protein [Kibdelosporangium philippinense]